MEKIFQLDTILKSKGFKVIERKSSDSFGDDLIIYTNDFLIIRIISDKSQLLIDIKKNGMQEWFDLILVITLITNKSNLLNFNFDEIKTILSHHYEEIASLFEDGIYINTRKKIEHLEKVRMRQMFPRF